MASREDRRGLGVVGLLALLGPQAGHAADPEPGEELPVELGGLVAERGGGRDHDDVAVGAARELREPREDHLVAELVLGAADHHHRARGAQVRRSTGGRGPSSSAQCSGRVRRGGLSSGDDRDRDPARRTGRRAGRPRADARLARLREPRAAAARRGGAHARGHAPVRRAVARGGLAIGPGTRGRARVDVLGPAAGPARARRRSRRASGTCSGSTRTSPGSTRAPPRTPTSPGSRRAPAACSAAPPSSRTS